MRLLEVADDNSVSFTRDLPDDEIPKYAILSHTWGRDEDEVTHQDIIKGSAPNKSGYRKIELCAQQARRHGLQYIWVDSCCINKADLSELSESINSMFKWYAKAEICYAFLVDVTAEAQETDRKTTEDREKQIRNSRWFTRGWTLQELLAPDKVEFYSAEWTLLGDKESLERLIAEITQIPSAALRQTTALKDFSTAERLAWQDKRRTKKEEDMAYSLLGLCGVTLSLIYGEGKDSAFRRLKHKIDKSSKGTNYEDFSITFALDDVIGVENFVARRPELQELRQVLSGDGSRRTVVLHGLGGMGKTQLMIAYAKGHRSDYSAIFWLNAKDADSLKASFANIARQILQVHLSAKHLTALDPVAPDVDMAVDAVKAWLSLPSNTRWLLLLDNLDNPKVPDNPDPEAIDIRKFLPSAQQGFVAVTTRSSRLDIGRQIHLQKLKSAEDSLKILSDMSKRDISLHDCSAVELTKKLDGLPLALATAGAYLRQSSMDFIEYLRWYETAWDKLLKTSPGLLSYEDRMLYSTWQVTFDRVNKINPLSAHLLRLWAYFDNQDLWYELLCHNDERMGHRPSWLVEMVKDRLTFEGAIRTLCDHGLVEPHASSIEPTESAGYSIHSCVHSWTRTVLSPDGNEELAIFALKCVAAHRPDSDVDRYWLVERRLLSHASSFIIVDLTGRWYSPRLAWELAEVAGLYLNVGKSCESESLYDRIWYDLKDANDDLRLKYRIAHNLGICCMNQDNLSKAENMIRQAKKGREKALGPHHESTLESMGLLASTLVRKKQSAQAKELYRRVLQGQKKAFGRDNMAVLETVRKLAEVCISLKQFDEAEGLLQRAAQGYSRSHVSGHPDCFGLMGSRAELYEAKGDLSMAEDTLVQLVQCRESALGRGHPATLASYHNLGRVLQMQKKWSESEKILLLALKGCETVYGRDGAQTLAFPVHTLAQLYQSQSNFDEAEQMYLRALRGLERAVGQERSMIMVMGNLGNMCRQQRRVDEAEEMILKALKGYEALYGEDHEITIRYPVINLGLL